MKGIYPTSYFLDSNVDKAKSIEEIWDDIDAYSGEFFEDEINFHEKIDFVIPLPPLDYNGKITKGIIFSQGSEYLLKLYPRLKEIFHVGAYTMWSSYSWCDKVDFYLSCYENKPRENYHKNKYQNKKDIIFLPLQDADFTNEYVVAPTFYPKKDIDVLCVSTPYPVKNLPILARALKIYEEKYKKILKTTIILGIDKITKDEKGMIDYSKIEPFAQEQLEQVKKILGDMYKYIDFIPFVNYTKLPWYYSNSKCCVLTSLIEGKNRSLNEAMSCNTPIITFKQHNQWARGEYPIFFGNSGELAQEFSPESFADAIHKVLVNLKKYEPRKNYLIYNGRKNFVNKIVDSIPYYSENIPDYKKGRIHENIWVDLACQENYQLGYVDFLYGKNPLIQHVRGLKKIDSLVKFFYSRFKIN